MTVTVNDSVNEPSAKVNAPSGTVHEPSDAPHRVPVWARSVLDLVDTIPAGRVMTYGDIARHLGMPSARQVGQVLSRYGHEVPWQRVVKADGALVPHNGREHLARLRAERTPLSGLRVDLRLARWSPPRAQGTREPPA